MKKIILLLIITISVNIFAQSDYRDDFMGMYYCIRKNTTDGVHNSFLDTLVLIKNENNDSLFDIIQSYNSDANGTYFLKTDSSFKINNDNYSTPSGYFHNTDSIYIIIYTGGATLPAWIEYYGKKEAMLIIKQNNKSKPLIFPNPAKDFINIKTNSKIQKFELFNLTGKKEIILHEDKKIIDVSFLKNGIYIYKIKTEKNEILTGKLLIIR